MIEALDLILELGLRLWQLWGVAFVILPFSLAVIAVWDFADWHKNRKL